MNAFRTKRAMVIVCACSALGLISVSLSLSTARGAPPHPNSHAAADRATLSARGDFINLPDPLKEMLLHMAGRPHTFLAMPIFAEAGKPSRLFQYYLLSMRGFEPNVFTAVIPGVNDTAMRTAAGPNDETTIGAVRLVVEPKPGLPTDPNDVEAFIDVFTDISGLFVINNESGWYEGWMIHDLIVANVDDPRPDGHAQFGKITADDATALAAMGAGHNVPGAVFTTNGQDARLPHKGDHFPDHQSNVVPLQLSMGAYNALQQGDVHSYWEFNYTTNWIHPLYELPFTGGQPGTFEAGQIGALQSIVPGSGPAGVQNDPAVFGDNPNLPRDPDKFEADDDEQREFRQRFIPSGLANEVFLDVYERLASFEPGVTGNQRLFDAYAAEVARVDSDGDGIISAVEGDVDTASDGFDNNERLFIPATAFNRFAVTREINDGLLAPRFAPSQRAWVLSGTIASVNPVVHSSLPRDGDDR